jgi:hypothetical protein
MKISKKNVQPNVEIKIIMETTLLQLSHLGIFLSEQ